MICCCTFWRRFGFFTAILLVAGCSKQGVDKQRNPTEENLYKIGRAYIQACYRLQRGPRNLEEIKSDMEGGFSADVLRSPGDGAEFVILWGVDFAKLPPGANDPFTVGGYEKNGTDGQRYVLRFPIQVIHMSDDAFKAAVFPPGHKPPP